MREMEGGGGGEERGTVVTWVDKHRTIYDRATRHPFVLSIRDGTVDFSSFKRWLGQDYIFVREFVPFVASVLLKACGQPDDGDGSEMEVILGGVASLNDELSWFKKEASKWNVQLSSVAPQQANLEYCRFLKSLRQPEVDFAVSITAFWAIEMVYQRSFALCLESDSNTPSELLEACQRWGSASFEQYCCFIQRIADRCLAKATDETLKHAEDAFVCVLEHEINFWNMSSGS